MKHLKELQEMEKLVVTMISHYQKDIGRWEAFSDDECIPSDGNIFGRVKDINPFPNKPWFLCVCSTSPLKTLWEKEKLLVMTPFHSVFYPFAKISAISIKFKIVICKIF